MLDKIVGWIKAGTEAGVALIAIMIGIPVSPWFNSITLSAQLLVSSQRLAMLVS